MYIYKASRLAGDLLRERRQKSASSFTFIRDLAIDSGARPSLSRSKLHRSISTREILATGDALKGTLETADRRDAHYSRSPALEELKAKNDCIKFIRMSTQDPLAGMLDSARQNKQKWDLYSKRASSTSVCNKSTDFQE